MYEGSGFFFFFRETHIAIQFKSIKMNFTFKRIARKNENKGDTLFITYDDFKISLLFLIIYSKLSDKGTKITQEEVNSINCDNVNQFFEYLGFKIPFEKIPNFIFLN